MSLDSDVIVDRRRIRRKLTFWRVFAAVVAIAAVVAVGVIATPSGRASLTSSGSIARVNIEGLIRSDQDRVEALERLSRSRARAVIVHLDSPGGTTAGSEAIYEEIRVIAKKKPVVAVMDTVAASGGYITAIAADHIVARGNTITGSIGVIFAFPEVSKLLDTLGIKMEEIKSGELKAAPSPYLRMAFPNTPAPYMEFLDMEGCDARDLARFEAELRRFLKTLTWRTGKRILLKSPTHTGRIDFLARMFPGAKFIHLVRDPRALFPSTQRLWRSLDAVQGMQVPREEGLDDYVFECLTRMYRGFDRQRPLIPPRDICDLRYEALVEDPVREVRRVYDALGLPGFEAVLPALEAHATAQQGYSPNQHALDPAVEAEIRRRWAKYCKAFGY